MKVKNCIWILFCALAIAALSYILSINIETIINWVVANYKTIICFIWLIIFAFSLSANLILTFVYLALSHDRELDKIDYGIYCIATLIEFVSVFIALLFHTYKRPEDIYFFKIIYIIDIIKFLITIHKLLFSEDD